MKFSLSSVHQAFHSSKKRITDMFETTAFSKSTMAVATGLGFGVTLEAGLATLFGVAASGLLSIGVGAVVTVAYLKLPDHHHDNLMSWGPRLLNAQSQPLPAGIDDEGASIKIMSHDRHNGDIIHVSQQELDDIIHHRFEARHGDVHARPQPSLG